MSSIDLERYSGALVPFGSLYDDSEAVDNISSSYYEIFKDAGIRSELQNRGLRDEVSYFNQFPETLRGKIHQDSYENPGRSVVINKSGDVVGSAKISGSQELRQLRTSLPVRLAFGPLSVRHLVPGSYIRAWTVGEDPELYTEIYGEMIRKIGHRAAWTVEPEASPAVIHDSITAAGMSEYANGRFVTGSNKLGRPVKSVVYVHDKKAA